MSALDIRAGDVVRLHNGTVETYDQTLLTISIPVGIGFTSAKFSVHRSAVAEIISRAETPEETIARLKAELAKAPRRIEWGGGECPVDCEVIVWFRNGLTKIEEAHSFGWSHADIPENKADDIIAYMVLPS